MTNYGDAIQNFSTFPEATRNQFFKLTIDLLNTFIKAERLCCDFFTFTLTITGDSKFIWLELSGPPGIKDFIKQDNNQLA